MAVHRCPQGMEGTGELGMTVGSGQRDPKLRRGKWVGARAWGVVSEQMVQAAMDVGEHSEQEVGGWRKGGPWHKRMSQAEQVTRLSV